MRWRGATAVAVAAGLLAAGCGGAVSSTADRAPVRATAEAGESWRGVALGSPVAMPDVTLTDTQGRPFDLREQTAGTPTLLFFGYTHCPDICPIHMANIARALEMTGLTPGTDLHVVFVTADPERDTPEVLGEFLGRFDDRFVGLTGTPQEIGRTMAALQLPPAVKEAELPNGGYTVGHPAQVMAFDAAGESAMVYPFGIRQADWVHDLPKIAEGDRWPT